MNNVLQQIKEFADKAHGKQTRKYSTEKYIEHPIRVMEMCEKHTSSIPILAAALLHDVLEDTGVSKIAMLQFLTTVMKKPDAEQTTQLVVELTDIYTKDKYPRWNRRRRKNKEAERIELTSGESQTIKYADTIDNCKEISKHDPEFAGVFLKECKMLLTRIPKGNETLYKEAIITVDKALQQVPQKFKV